MKYVGQGTTYNDVITALQCMTDDMPLENDLQVEAASFALINLIEQRAEEGKIKLDDAIITWIS
jgi:hypothetical protein